MKLLVNGCEQELDSGATVADLVPRERRGIAVVLDGEVVPRLQWEQVALRDGQKIDVLEATAGG